MKDRRATLDKITAAIAAIEQSERQARDVLTALEQHLGTEELQSLLPLIGRLDSSLSKPVHDAVRGRQSLARAIRRAFPLAPLARSRKALVVALRELERQR